MEKITSKKDFSIQGVQWMDTDDGYAFNFTLKLHGKKIAEAVQGGYGGPTDIRYFSPEAQKAVQEWCAAQPKSVSENLIVDGKPFECDLDDEGLMDELFGDWDEARQRKNALNALKRAAKTKTLFRLKSDDEGVYHLVGALGERAMTWLRNKYGDQLAQIFSPEKGQWVEA